MKASKVSAGEGGPSEKTVKDQGAENGSTETSRTIMQQIESIKILAVATTIMEMTRRLSKEKKNLVKAFCDKLLFNKKLIEAKERHEEIIPSLIDYHTKNVDPQRIAIVKNLQFPQKGKEKLKDWYN